MRGRTATFLAITLSIFSCSTEYSVEQNLRTHIEYLASDELQGREAGTPEEKEAAEYISNQFSFIGMIAAGEDGFYQDFDFLMGKNPGELEIIIDAKELLSESYFPMNFSANGEVAGELINVGFGIEAADLEYNDYQNAGNVSGKIVVFNISSPDGIHPHSKYLNYHGLRDRVKIAKEKGASGVILINEDPTASDPDKNYTKKMARVEIPVLFINDPSILQDANQASLKVELFDDERQGRNVIGLINNESEYTVVMGAHYDHLGFGQHGGSLYRGEEIQVHNGADDNASGTAMLIELARTIKKEGPDNLNYLFIAFSGEEKGLLGANYFTKNPTIDLQKVTFMINMDMVGRLDTADYSIAINGVGTSPTWDSLINSITIPPLDINTTESGVGPSDQTAFYLADIPVLHFFTGTHENYHKPTDDIEYINYPGMMLVYQYILDLINSLSDDQKLVFTKTMDSNSRNAPSFTVTLGIVPDYMYDSGGVRIDGITDGKPAALAGMQKGDIVKKLGNYDIEDIYAYMDALGKFKKGDKVVATLLREQENIEVEVEF